MNTRALLRLIAAVSIASLLVYGGMRWESLLAQTAATPRTPTPRGPLGEEERSTIQLFESARGSVVYIATVQRVYDPWTRNPLQVPRGTGSGFIWDAQGHVVTNNHVIAGASGAEVRLADGRAFQADLVGTSEDHDLAVLRIRVDKERPLPLPLGTSRDLKVGQKVLAVGNPFGLDWTLTSGIVSALNRELPGEDGASIRELIQTDAAINPGNSGGPLLDSAGRLIGVTTAIYSPSGAYAGVGFAVPVDTVNRVVPRLIATGRYVRPTLGVRYDAQINQALVEQVGTKGVFVLAVEPNSPAASAGLRPARIGRNESIVIGDVITAFDDRPIAKVEDLIDALDRSAPGQLVRVTVERGNDKQQLSVRLAAGR